MVGQIDNFVVQTAGLTKTFRDFWGHTRVIAVDSLDLEIRQGEVFGLLGPNGSGKSTTIKMLLGLLFPTRGVASVLGKPPGDVKTNSHIGFLPEESYLYPFLNARETLDFYGRIFGLSRAIRKERIDSLLDMVGLSSAARRPIGEFSKGMARRIGLAQALINDPDFLILDEPTSGLDPLGTRQIKDLIMELGRRGKTVLLCSHLLADVEDVCDRIGILYGGKLRDLGTMDELLAVRGITQIRTKQLTPETLEKVKALIQDEAIEVETPRDRLEDYFLRIVSEAQAEQLETSGALMGGGISDFLGGGEEETSPPTQVLEALISGREGFAEGAQDSELTTPVSATAEPEVRRDMLNALARPAADLSDDLTTPVQPAPTDLASEAAAGPVDRSVIDDLTDASENHDHSGDDADKPGETGS